MKRKKSKRESKNSSDVVREFAKKENITLTDSKQLIDSFLDLIADTIISGEDIVFSGFGRFYYAHKKEKRGVHPISKKETLSQAYDTMLFKASNGIKEKMNIEE